MAHLLSVENEHELCLFGRLSSNIIGLIMIFNAILPSRQSGQKLHCLYGNPMANDFFMNHFYQTK